MISYCFNTKTAALTTWNNYAFSRIWQVGPKTYGVRSNGLFTLEGDNDLGTPVNSTFTLAPTDLGSTALKRLAYIRLDADVGAQPMQVSIKADDQVSPISTNTNDFNTAKRVKLGKGIRGRFLSVIVSNASKVRSMELYPEATQRGVR